MADLANGELQNGEADAQVEGEEQEATLIKKSVKLESQLGDDEEPNKENVDDKTEDQVPDITNNEDPMTTSMDGIEEISANEGEPKEEEAPVNGEANEEVPVEQPEEQAEGAEAAPAEDENTEKDFAEIPVNVYDGSEEKVEAEEPKAEGEAEEAQPEEAPAQEESAPEAEAEQPVDVEAEQPVAEEAPAEEQPVEEEKPEESGEQQNEAAAEDDGVILLRAPPVPKRPRTPNELDEPQEGEAEQQPTEAEAEQPAEAEAEKEPEQPAMADVPIEVEGLPSTPKSFGSRRGSNKSNLAADNPPSVASPVPATPKSGATTTPKSTKSGSAFDFDKPKKTKKSTTFEDEVLSVKSSKSRSPRSPRSPRTPKSPKVEEPKPEEEAPKEPEADNAGAAADEEEKQRQASFEARLKEREEEEARWKRMTSWDKGEDIKEVPVESEPEPTIEEEEKPSEGGEAEEAKVEGEEPVAAVEEPQEEEAVPPVEQAEAEEKPAEEEGGEQAPEAQESLEAPRASPEGTPPPPPPRPERSPSPIQRREPSSRDYAPYDQEMKGETVPSRMPADESFSSWTGVERDSYKPISPWVDRTSKYRNEYTVGEPPVAPSAYTAFFDDLVSSGPFASSLYSTSRVLERSRSRTRERRQALRSQSQARNYFRFASQHPVPLRSRDYSTPPSSMVSRAPTAGSSFVSFMDYAGAKQYEMARSQSLQRSPLYQSNLALSRSVSRGGIDYYLGSGRASRVDSYVDSLHRPYEWNMPSNYEMYRASSRGQVGYAPLNHYQSYVDTLQRSLSRERYERDRLRNKYTTVSYQLEQMDLLRSSNYSALRSGSAPRTSVYAHFYPYY